MFTDNGCLVDGLTYTDLDRARAVAFSFAQDLELDVSICEGPGIFNNVIEIIEGSDNPRSSDDFFAFAPDEERIIAETTPEEWAETAAELEMAREFWKDLASAASQDGFPYLEGRFAPFTFPTK